jgi:CDP-glucose 4,6-dehydratase
MWLHSLGAQVTGYALDPPSDPSLFEVARVGQLLVDDIRADIRDAERLAETIQRCDPSVVFHLAAQPLVLASLAQPRETFDVNVLGTANLCDAIRTNGQACAVVIATSDKCYRNDGSGRAFEENDPLGGHDPYSASKAGAELVASAYRDSYFAPDQIGEHGVRLATVRSGNVIGGGDWADDRLVPDAVRALAAGQSINIRHPRSIRPWQHVLEPLSGYLSVAGALIDGALGTAWNFGPDPAQEYAVSDLVSEIIAAWGEGDWTADATTLGDVEATTLRLSSTKARHDLGWGQQWSFTESVSHTIAWYHHFYDDPTASMREHSLRDIERYEQSALSAP